MITILKVDTLKAGATAKTVSVTVFDSLGLPAAGKWVRFGASSGSFPDSVQSDLSSAIASATWFPPDLANKYTLTGVRGTVTPFTSLADSAGHVVIRQSVVILPDVPFAQTSSLAISVTNLNIPQLGRPTVTVTVKDRFGNLVNNPVPGTDFTFSTSGGSGGGLLGTFTCAAGVCTTIYTPVPGFLGTVPIAVKIGGNNIVNSPITVTNVP